MAQHSDDSEMSRFDREGVRHFSARQAVLAVALVMAILLVFSGGRPSRRRGDRPRGSATI